MRCHGTADVSGFFALRRPGISQAAVFLDRDGTLIEEIPYLCDPESVRLVPTCLEALALLKGAGFKLVLISNQSGVARGYFERADVEAVNQALVRLLSVGQGQLDAMYYCVHHPDGLLDELSIQCRCRKPGPEMILRACEDLQLDVSNSYMIGNADCDVGAGNAAGCTSMLILNAGGFVSPAAASSADWTGGDLLSAARWILEREGGASWLPNRPSFHR